MHSQLNSPKEMTRRLVFLVYIASILAFSLSLIISLARSGVGELIVAVSSFGVLTAVRYIGYRWLEFDRLFESFPAGCARDGVSEPVRTEVECLVEEFHAPRTDWVRRAAIRRRLLEMEQLQPEIIEAYSEDLSRILAA